MNVIISLVRTTTFPACKRPRAEHDGGDKNMEIEIMRAADEIFENERRRVREKQSDRTVNNITRRPPSNVRMCVTHTYTYCRWRIC